VAVLVVRWHDRIEWIDHGTAVATPALVAENNIGEWLRDGFFFDPRGEK
jgi:hypothetical protein